MKRVPSFSRRGATEETMDQAPSTNRVPHTGYRDLTNNQCPRGKGRFHMQRIRDNEQWRLGTVKMDDWGKE